MPSSLPRAGPVKGLFVAEPQASQLFVPGPHPLQPPQVPLTTEAFRDTCGTTMQGMLSLAMTLDNAFRDVELGKGCPGAEKERRLSLLLGCVDSLRDDCENLHALIERARTENFHRRRG